MSANCFTQHAKARPASSTQHKNTKRRQTFLNNGFCVVSNPHWDLLEPRSWPATYRWSIILSLGTMTFITSLAPSTFAPSIPETMRDFGSSSSLLASLVVSVYVLGWASGPLIVSPLSELFGRLWVYHASNTLFVLFTVACALSNNLDMLIGSRFLAGATGSAVLNIGGGTVADLFVQEERGKAMTVWTIGALLGPIVGPAAGGILAETWGWRSSFWVISIAGAVSTLIFFLVNRETYKPILLARHDTSCMHDTLGSTMQSPQESDSEKSSADQPCEPATAAQGSPQPNTASQKLSESIFRPLHMLAFSPIVLLSSIYIALVYGYLILLITTMPSVFGPTYNFSTAAIGYSYLGLGTGMMISVLIFGVVSDRLLKALAKRGADQTASAAAEDAEQAEVHSTQGKSYKPEHRLPPLLPGSMLIPTGILLYGWAAQQRLHWIVPILGTGLLGAGMNASLMSIQTYLVDAYPVYAASALAANTVLRSLMGAFLPLAGPSMFKAMGFGWGCTLLAGLGYAFMPAVVLGMKYGERWRTKGRFAEVGEGM